VLTHEDFASFFRQEYPRLVLFLLKEGASEPEAEDGAQEAMAQALAAWDRPRSPRAWVRRAAFTIYVRHATRLRREQAALAQAVSVTSRASVAEANYKEGQWRIVAIMRQLPPEQRKVAALFYDGLTQYEIAEVIGKPVATVRSLLRHARIRLKEVIQSQGLDSPDGAS
jgi:RNA polymerase sigma-70 factor (ECF subfamily)